MKSFVLLVLLATVTICFGNISNKELEILLQNGPKNHCGRNLAAMLDLVCNEFQKRSNNGLYNAILPPYYRDQEAQFGWPWMPSHKARGSGMPSRGKRYIVNECCEKPCDIDELLSYC